MGQSNKRVDPSAFAAGTDSPELAAISNRTPVYLARGAGCGPAAAGPGSPRFCLPSRPEPRLEELGRAMLFSWQRAADAHRGAEGSATQACYLWFKYGLFQGCSHPSSQSKSRGYLCPEDNGTEKYTVPTEKDGEQL